jgi:hypothetical protein
MTQAISAARLNLLRRIVQQPGVPREQLLATPGVGPADLDYLASLELIQERESGRVRATHRGETVVRRSL